MATTGTLGSDGTVTGVATTTASTRGSLTGDDGLYRGGRTDWGRLPG